MNPTPEMKRQLLHISVVLFALLLPFLSAQWMFMIAIMGFVHNVLLLPRYAPHLFRKRERLWHGITVYPLMVALLILLFSDRLILAAGSWAILSFGDGFSNLLGKSLPILRLPWNPEKSVGGMLAFWIFGTIGAVLLMAFTGPIPSWWHVLFAAAAAAVLAGIFETLPLPWDDNIVVALVSAGTLAVVWGVDLTPQLPHISLPNMITALIVNASIAPVAWWFGWVSKSGALCGSFIGMLVWMIGGFHYFSILILFFLTGLAVTRMGYHEKDYMGVAQEDNGKRSAKHALANCLLAVLSIIGIGFLDGIDLYFQLFFAAAFATAIADTVATELGQLYGKTPFMPTTFRAAKPGTVGAISAEGTLFGMGAALLFSIYAFAVAVIPLQGIPAVAVGAWAGSFLESYISSRWTDEGVEVSNEWMNLLNTLLGGSLALIVFVILGGQ